jgi:hypothetical protein
MTRIASNGNVRLAAAALLTAVIACQVAVADEPQRLITVAEFGESTATMWSPTLEWTLRNDSHTGNPFDLVAKVTFRHESGKETRTTEMFHASKNTWKFRFTGTRVGKWTFTTQADGKGGTTNDPELDGRKGTITVKANPDPKITGFLTSVGDKYAVQTGSDAEPKAYLFNVFQAGWPYFDLLNAEYQGDLAKCAAKYAAAAKVHGMGVINAWLMHNLMKLGTRAHEEHDSVDPDPRAFELLEQFIITAHENGVRTHFWYWGDEARKQTPIGLPGGINGKVDKRLQRYIAARLGPIPGWSLSYGFDLHEWVNEKQCNEWFDFMQEKLGWNHMLSARARWIEADHPGAVQGIPGGGPKDFAGMVAEMEKSAKHVHFYEERFELGRWHDADQTRRLLWWQPLSGGMASWYGIKGNYQDRKTIRAVLDGEKKYPNANQFRTHAEFWKDRFLLEMQRAADLSDGYCIRSLDNKKFVFYKEDADSIQLDLSVAGQELPAIAIDTRKDYRELDLKKLPPKKQTWKAPYKSDWAIAVGKFGARSRGEQK